MARSSRCSIHQLRVVAGAGASAAPDPANNSDAAKQIGQANSGGLLQKVKDCFTGGSITKEKLASLGMGAVASYSVISNATYCTCLAIAWLTFVKTTGQSPLWPGQWKPFLLFYAGLWTVQNFVRPLRFGLAVALAPAFDRGIDLLGQKLKLRKSFAFGVLLVCIALITVTCLATAIWLGGGFLPGPPPAAA